MNIKRIYTVDEGKAIRGAVATLIEILRPAAEEEAERGSRTLKSCLTSAVRQYIEAAVVTRPRDVDGRETLWQVKMYFWDINEGADRADKIAESNVETVRGFNEVGRLIQEYAGNTHPAATDLTDLDGPFEYAELIRRLGTIRPAISRGGGSATMRLRYVLKNIRYICQVDIKRA